jgi:hypothetical protein
VRAQDLFNGPWGAAAAPDPRATYTFVRRKTKGANPGVVVSDPAGREWSVKQAPHSGGRGDEGPAEVVLSRVLSAIGYHQPPVYYVPVFTMVDDSGPHNEPGGRFRLHGKALKDIGTWAWDENPFVETTPYRGLLAILLLFNNSDLKDSNNTVYERAHGDPLHWYVVRDLGCALGETSRFRPRRNDVRRFEESDFIRGLDDHGYVEFKYGGKNKRLIERTITPADLGWAAALLDRLSDRQWGDAFRAGGYAPDVTARYLRVLRARLAAMRDLSRRGRFSAERR